MSGRDPTQKQIAEKYKGNLAYFKQGHYMRRWRGILFFLAVVGSIGGALSFKYWGNEEYLSTGPISENHSSFANNCKACHEGAESDLLKVLPFGNAGNLIGSARELSLEKLSSAVSGAELPNMEAVKKTAEAIAVSVSKRVEHDFKADNLVKLAEQGLSYTQLSRMDSACLKCHAPMELHQPQSTPIALIPAFKDIPLVHSGTCTSCHREHIGHGRMKLPGSESCATCHNNLEELKRTRDYLHIGNPRPLTAGRAENVNIKGLVRFLTPPKPASTTAFESYAGGHPGFDYEQPGLRDPAHIKYNHARHGLGDIPKLNGHKLTCTDCHEKAGSGVNYQKVSYEKHCQSCHSLLIDPELPELLIPHGDPQKVAEFINIEALLLKYAQTFVARGVNKRDVPGKLSEAMERLTSRGWDSPEKFKESVFFSKESAAGKERGPSNRIQELSFPACAKCHDVESTGGGVPKVVPTNIAERWVQRGPFTHLPHVHIDCLSCHGGAVTSKATADILMPTQKSCAECHRPVDKDKLQDSADTIRLRAELKPDSGEMARIQRLAGGVKAECQSCHVFHAPPAATILKVQAGKK